MPEPAQPELPELHEGVLDPPTLARLFAELAAHARVDSVTLKGGQEQYAGAEPVTLDAARDALSSGRVHGVQIRYQWQGRAWCDTLLRVPGGVRVVRADVTPSA